MMNFRHRESTLLAKRNGTVFLVHDHQREEKRKVLQMRCLDVQGEEGLLEVRELGDNEKGIITNI